jgi:cytochrome c oxidase subunit II
MGEETRPEPKTSRAVTRRHVVQMVVAGVIASAAGIALGIAIDWFPTAASAQAGPIDDLWDVLIIASVPIFVLVCVVVVASVRLFRQRPGEEGLDGPPIHGSTRLEVAWTALPAALIIGLCAYAWTVLIDIEQAPADNQPELAERRVQVVGEQFAWTFRYNEGGRRFSSNRLYLPAGESVRFDVTSKDVIHDFWVPGFRMKIDAVPGITTGYRVTPTLLGEHEVVCAELCGVGHAYMRQTVVIQRPQEFQAWVRRQVAAAGAAGAGGGGGGGAGAGGSPGAEGEGAGQQAAADGKEIFTAGNPDTGAIACGTCHTLADAGTTAQTGPDLDEFAKDATANDLRHAIEEPNAEVEEGFSEGIMPTNYGETLSEAQLSALVSYLVEASK